MKAQFKCMMVLLFLFGCSDNGSQPLSSRSYELWKSLGIHDYTIDQVRICFCAEGGQAMRVIVRSDSIVSVRRISDGSLVPYPASTFYLTVDSLFGIIHQSKTDSLVIRYNKVHGFPEELDINPQLHPVDGGVLYVTSNLHVP
jgi:hypothetical protein